MVFKWMFQTRSVTYLFILKLYKYWHIRVLIIINIYITKVNEPIFYLPVHDIHVVLQVHVLFKNSWISRSSLMLLSLYKPTHTHKSRNINNLIKSIWTKSMILIQISFIIELYYNVSCILYCIYSMVTQHYTKHVLEVIITLLIF